MLADCGQNCTVGCWDDFGGSQVALGCAWVYLQNWQQLLSIGIEEVVEGFPRLRTARVMKVVRCFSESFDSLFVLAVLVLELIEWHDTGCCIDDARHHLQIIIHELLLQVHTEPL